MTKRWISLLTLACTLLGQTEDSAELFEMRIRPLIVGKCHACHTGSKMGGLELVSRESLLKGGNSGPAIVAGDPENSLLIQAVRRSHARIKMPPQENLKPEEIADLVAWVKAGAVWPTAPALASSSEKKLEYVITPEQRAFWSFQPVVVPEPPPVRDTEWAEFAIDRFVLARLEQKGLKPGRRADRRTLIRRAYFDLIGLPPSPEAVDAFVKDRSADAFEKVVDELLRSAHYGERWGRHWLDLARYSDDQLTPGGNDSITPYPSAFRYRDWVVKAFNDDMPYDRFVKAQIAGDLMGAEAKDLIPGLGLYGLSPEFQEDRVDVTSRTFLGLTVACAQCHDHKFDPIPQKDFLSWSGIFDRTRKSQYPLAPKEVVDLYDGRKKSVDEQQERIRKFIDEQSQFLGEMLAHKAARYMMAARELLRAGERDGSSLAAREGLDPETLERWANYLKDGRRDHAFLKHWEELGRANAPEAELRAAAEQFQTAILDAIEEKKRVDRENVIRLGGSSERNNLASTELAAMKHEQFLLWGDFFKTGYGRTDPSYRPNGFLYYGEGELERWLSGEWLSHLKDLRAELKKLKDALPEQYPFVHVIENSAARRRRGPNAQRSEEVPPRFLSVLSKEEPKPFDHAKARLELAEAIANPANPLTARVMVNRIWMHHFGTGLVRTPSNFGQLGERPSHSELLDYLASRFVAAGWSIKAMHREIMLSATYALSAEVTSANNEADPENRLFWRANRRRLSAEELRDAMLAATGELDPTTGGAPAKLGADHTRRTLYSFVSRQKPDPTLAMFDFPNPNVSAERRIPTSTPLQGLYFLNSDFVAARASAFARLLAGEPDDAARIRKAYRILYYREPVREEIQLGIEYVGRASWARYAQVLLTSNEFLHVN
jgi:hypothetical protein